MFDDSSNGTADITIDLSRGTSAIGIGIADSDPVSITLQALAANGSALGSPFSVTIPETGPNPGNGYYVVEDSTPDIFGLTITQTAASTSYSGLAIDDLQTAPEPSTVLLLTAGVALLGFARLRGRPDKALI